MAAACGLKVTRRAAHVSTSLCPLQQRRTSRMPHSEIFVIDDDAAMRESLAFLLQSAGYVVRLFESAQIFFDRMPQYEACCILTDVRMPGIDGIELLRRLNAVSDKRQAHVI